MAGQRPPGLYLKPPHGELSHTGAKTALAKAREFGFEGQEFTLCSGPVAWGEVVLAMPEAVGIEEFDARFREHRVTVREREKWWPDEQELFLYPYAEWRPYMVPQQVKVPATVQTLMGPVEFLGEKEADMPGPSVVINIGSDGVKTTVDEDHKLARAMAGDGEAIAELEKARGEGQGQGGSRQGDGGADECVCPECGATAVHEKGTPCADVECPKCGAAMEGKAEKIWKPSEAEGHTRLADTPEKQRQWAAAANSSLKDCLAETEGTPTAEQRSECEGRAVRIANAAVKKNPAQEKAMDSQEFTDRRSKQVQAQVSYSDIQSMVWRALSPEPERETWPNDVEVYDTYITYEIGGRHYMRAYAVVDGALRLGEAVELEIIMKPKCLADLPEGYKAELVQEFDALELGDKSLSDDEKAALTYQQRQALPESSYAWVETGEGCEKGEDGKRPQKCLHLPYKDGDGKLDCARVRNARARIPQMSGVPQAAKDKIEAAQEKCTAQTATARGKAVEALRGQADRALGAVADLWKSVTGSGGETATPDFALGLEGDTGFKTFKGADGKIYILTWTTNAFKDRDGEIFTTASIEEYADRAWKEIKEKGSKGQMDFWHAPGSEFADITFAGAVGRFLVELGEFHDDEVGQGFEKFFTADECAEARKAMAPDGWGASHHYRFRPGDRADGVYEWFDKVRTSVLAAGRAANPYTNMEVLGKMLNDEQRERLGEVEKAIGVPDFAKMVEERGMSVTKQLEGADVAFKQQDGEPGKEGAGQAGDVAEAVAKRVLELIQVESLGGLLQGLSDGQEAMKAELGGIKGRLDEVEKGDLERMKEKESWRPQLPWGSRPSLAEGNVLGDEGKDAGLKDKGPEVPQAIQRAADIIMGAAPAAGGGSA